MIFIDSNIPMYLIGAPHPNKERALRALDRLVRAEQRLVTSAEVLQEILHRFVAIGRRDGIQPAFDAVLGVVDEVFPVDIEDVHRARALVQARAELSARDAMHVAVMERYEVARILSFDRGFDTVPGLERLEG